MKHYWIYEQKESEIKNRFSLKYLTFPQSNSLGAPPGFGTKPHNKVENRIKFYIVWLILGKPGHPFDSDPKVDYGAQKQQIK